MTADSLLQSVIDCMNTMSMQGLANAFENYCQSNGHRRYCGGNPTGPTYIITWARGGHKVECRLDNILFFVLRKERGYYFIIGKSNCERYAEVENTEGHVNTFDSGKLRELIADHKALFDFLGIKEDF